MKVIYELDQLDIDRPTVLTIGSFDGVHQAHQTIIKRLKNLAAEVNGLATIISFHPHPRKIVYPKDKSLRLLTTLDEKIALFEKFGVDLACIVPFTVEFSQMDPVEYVEKFIIEAFKPKYIVIGYDHRFGLNRAGDVALLRQYKAKGGYQVIEIQKEVQQDITISSTKIRNALDGAQMALANDLLGHQYSITGEVVHGEKIGTLLGYPTANLKILDEDKLIPAYGVYAVNIVHEDRDYGGMLYIGDKPTFGDESERVIEVNIFDFQDKIYNDQLTIKFIDFIRSDEKFESKELLVEQLKKDEIRTKAILSSQRKKKPNRVAIAILAYNNKSYLEAYLPMLSNSSESPFDIWVIDNASTDNTLDYLAEWHPEVKVISLPKNYGFAGGYNEGLKQIDAEYYVILNSDVQVTSGWLDPIIDRLDQDKNIAAAQPKILSLEHKTNFEYAGAAGGFIDWLGYPFCRGRIFDHVEQDEGQYDKATPIFWASGAAMVVKASLFNDLGGFDTDYFAHQEEIDLCWRINNLGYQIWYEPRSTVYHLGGGTLDYSHPRKLYLNYRNNLRTILKNAPSDQLTKILICRFFLDQIAAWKELISGNWTGFKNIYRAIFTFYKEYSRFREKRNANLEGINTHDTKASSQLHPRSVLWSYFVKGKKVFGEL